MKWYMPGLLVAGLVLGLIYSTTRAESAATAPLAPPTMISAKQLCCCTDQRGGMCCRELSMCMGDDVPGCLCE